MQSLIVVILLYGNIFEYVFISHKMQYLLVTIENMKISDISRNKWFIYNFNKKTISQWKHPSNYIF